MITRLKLSTIEQGLPKYRSMLAGNDAYIPTSFESIATVSGTGSTSSITFSSIPSGFQHLQIRIMQYDTSQNGSISSLRFNGDTNTNYDWHRLNGSGTAASASAGTDATGIQVSIPGFTASAFYGVSVIDIHDYASTTKNKTTRAFFGVDMNGSGFVYLGSGLWRNTNAVNSITIFNTGGFNYDANSRFALYGIKGA